jgi:hypothetical protein
MWGHISQIREVIMHRAYRVLVVKPEEKMLLERPRRRWERDVTMDPKKIW